MTKAFLLLASMLLAAPSLYADDAEDKAVATVRQLGGKVLRDDKDPAHPVMSVDLSNTQVTSADLKELAALKNLKVLDLFNTPVTDESLKEVAALKNLTMLHLGGAG